jgi:hypothetical protein
MDPTETTDDGGRPQQAAFRFVSDGTDQSARSHAMREHWKHRRQRSGVKKRKAEEAQQRPLPIRPNVPKATNLEDRKPPTRSSGSANNPEGPQLESQCLNRADAPFSSLKMDSVRSQALRGMNLALGINELDPFDQFPIKFTPQHHKLLHHCQCRIPLHRLNIFFN